MLIHEIGSQVAHANSSYDGAGSPPDSAVFRTPSKSDFGTANFYPYDEKSSSSTAPPKDRLNAKMRDYHESILTFSQRLLKSNFNASSSLNSILLCTCARAGFLNLSALLSLGPTFNKRHIGTFFGLWQESVQQAKSGKKVGVEQHCVL